MVSTSRAGAGVRSTAGGEEWEEEECVLHEAQESKPKAKAEVSGAGGCAARAPSVARISARIGADALMGLPNTAVVTALRRRTRGPSTGIPE